MMRFLSFLRDNLAWLAAGFLLNFMSSFGQTYFIAVFAGELRTAFDLSHSAWGGIYTLGTLASALLMVATGALADRVRARTMGVATLIGLSLACLAMATNQVVWLLPVVVFLLRFTGQGMCGHVASVAIVRWFLATRGRALAIAVLGFSVGEALLPVIFVAALEVTDWRNLWLVAAGIALAGVPVLILLLRKERTPAATYLDQSQNAGMDGRHWTRLDAVRDPLFWCVVPALSGLSAWGTVFFFQQVHFAPEKGLTHLELVSLFPIYPAIAVMSSMLSGWALDKWGTARLFPFFLVGIILDLLIFALADSRAGVLLGLIFFGITAGSNATLPSAFWAEFYGTRHIGGIRAMATALMVFGSAVGPGVSGILLDLNVSMSQQYLIYALYFLAATAVLGFGLRRASVRLAQTL